MPSSAFSFTQTGLTEMKRAIEEFPATETAALKAVARATAERILQRERQLLLSQTHGHGNTAAAIHVEEDSVNKQFIVRFGLIRNRPANTPLWLEYGTVHMDPRPFVRPAADAERDRYRRELETASAAAAQKVFR